MEAASNSETFVLYKTPSDVISHKSKNFISTAMITQNLESFLKKSSNSMGISYECGLDSNSSL